MGRLLLHARARGRRRAPRRAPFSQGAARPRVVVHDFRDGFLPYSGAAVKEAFEALKKDFSPDLVFTHYRRRPAPGPSPGLGPDLEHLARPPDPRVRDPEVRRRLRLAQRLLAASRAPPWSARSTCSWSTSRRRRAGQWFTAGPVPGGARASAAWNASPRRASRRRSTARKIVLLSATAAGRPDARPRAARRSAGEPACWPSPSSPPRPSLFPPCKRRSCGPPAAPSWPRIPLGPGRHRRGGDGSRRRRRAGSRRPRRARRGAPRGGLRRPSRSRGGPRVPPPRRALRERGRPLRSTAEGPRRPGRRHRGDPAVRRGNRGRGARASRVVRPARVPLRRGGDDAGSLATPAARAAARHEGPRDPRRRPCLPLLAVRSRPVVEHPRGHPDRGSSSCRSCVLDVARHPIS